MINPVKSVEKNIKKPLEKDIRDIEKFVNEDLPEIRKSNNEALFTLEQLAINIKALLNKRYDI